MSPLSMEHREALALSAITAAVVSERGYRSITEKSELAKIGFSKAQQNVPALAIPVYGVDGDIAFYQIRPDKPRVKDSKPIKYETPSGVKMAIDAHPSIRERLQDPGEPLWITEGIKKADSAISKGLTCVGLLGVWNWRGRNKFEGLTALGDWESIALKGRQIYIVFDSDLKDNKSVRAALHRLTAFLKSRGASVSCVFLDSVDQNKVGLDDFFASGGDVEQLKKLAADHVEEGDDDGTRERRTSLVTRALELLPDAEFFHTADGECLARLHVKGHFEVYFIDSKPFSLYVQGLFYQAERRALSDSLIKEIVNALGAKARFDGETHAFHIRIAHVGGKIFVDLGDPNWSVVEIDAEGWRILGVSPVRFIRPNGFRELAKPVPGGSIGDLRKFINADSDDDFVLVTAFLFGAFLDPTNTTFPLLVLTGEKGTAKSTTAKVLHRIVDPRQVELRKLAKQDDTVIAASKSKILAIDNLGRLTPAQSDLLCTLVSGGGISKRELYTNGDEYLIEARLPLILTGIEDVVDAQDLVDRSLIPKLKFIDASERMTEDAFWSNFNLELPRILGWFYSALSTALKMKSTVVVTQLPRLADFYVWVLAAEPAMGEYQGLFVKAFNRSRDDSNALAIEDSTLGSLIVRWFNSTPKLTELKEVKVTPSDLRKALVESADEPDQREVPSTKQIRGELRKLAGALRSAGINVNTDKSRSGSGRWIVFWGTPPEVVICDTIVTDNPETPMIGDGMQAACDDDRSSSDDLGTAARNREMTHDDDDDNSANTEA